MAVPHTGRTEVAGPAGVTSDVQEVASVPYAKLVGLEGEALPFVGLGEEGLLDAEPEHFPALEAEGNSPLALGFGCTALPEKNQERQLGWGRG